MKEIKRLMGWRVEREDYVSNINLKRSVKYILEHPEMASVEIIIGLKIHMNIQL